MTDRQKHAWVVTWNHPDRSGAAVECACGWEVTFDTPGAALNAVDAHLGVPVVWAGPLP